MTGRDEAAQLLREWFLWWASDPDVPAKLPNALQVRTALFLQTHAEISEDPS